MKSKQHAWIAAATKSLANKGSWTGRTHLHKHLFITHALGLADIPFDFELYHYGPYSFELDSVVAEMEAFGELEKRYRKVGYGPSYEVTLLGEESLAELDAEELEVSERVAGNLAPFDSADLELTATCLYVELIEGEDEKDVIVPRVQEIKPKYSVTQIELALRRAQRLRNELRP